MLFVLIYFPLYCHFRSNQARSGSWKWAIFTAGYTTGLAWLVAFTVFQIGSIIINKPKIICLSSMELQQIIVIAIVCLCTIWISIRIFQYFKRIKNNSNPCECCNSDCAMKSMHNKPKCGCEKKCRKVRKKIAKYLQIKKKCRTFATAIEKQRLITIRFLG